MTKQRPAGSKESPAVSHSASGKRPSASDLLDRAVLSARNAYAPYSAFRVGAVALTEAGTVATGCNVENASFPVGVCAERNAIAAAVMAEGPGMRLAAVAIAALDPKGEPIACAPCGACRQTILEFGPKARVIFRSGDAVTEVFAEALLPGAFSFARAPS